jgi:lysozyme
MNTSQQGLDLIKECEGCVLTAYPDPGTGGEPWTIGVGHTGGVHPGMTITQEEADELLREDLKTAERAVEALVKVPLSTSQNDALVSFTFNLGAGNLGASTLLKKLNAYDYRGAAAEFDKWTRAGSRVLPGLVTRRAKERALFESEMVAA